MLIGVTLNRGPLVVEGVLLMLGGHAQVLNRWGLNCGAHSHLVPKAGQWCRYFGNHFSLLRYIWRLLGRETSQY
jgi:hypothetical protein